MFLPSGGKECAGCVLADTLLIIGVKLVQDTGKSDKVCRPCARKIRNAADCITFITGKLTKDNAEPEEQKATEDISSTPSKSLAASPSSKRQKRLLPTTVKPVRAAAKRSLGLASNMSEKPTFSKSLFAANDRPRSKELSRVASLAWRSSHSLSLTD